MITATLQWVSKLSVLFAACHLWYLGQNVDYDSGKHTVTFPAGVTRISFDTVITNDVILENDEQFNLIINSSSLPTGVSGSHPSLVTVTIVDDDGNI